MTCEIQIKCVQMGYVHIPDVLDFASCLHVISEVQMAWYNCRTFLNSRCKVFYKRKKRQIEANRHTWYSVKGQGQQLGGCSKVEKQQKERKTCTRNAFHAKKNRADMPFTGKPTTDLGNCLLYFDSSFHFPISWIFQGLLIIIVSKF